MTESPSEPPAFDLMRNIVPYVGMSEIAGQRPSLQMLPDLLRRYSWSQTFLSLATLAAQMANSPDGPSSEAVLDRSNRQLTKFRFHSDELLRRVGETFERIGDSRPIVHEQALYFLQALAVVYCTDEGGAPTDELLALMLLMANDYMADWLDDGDLDELEHGLAGFFLSSRFASRVEPFNAIIRARLMFDVPPRSGLSPSEWSAIEAEAFGRSFAEYFDAFVLPLVLQASTWCRGPKFSDLPVIQPSAWYSQTVLRADYPQALLARLAVDREAARAAVQKITKPSKIPHAPQVFFRSPFLRIDDDSLVAASPWVVRDHLHLGIWARFLATFKKRDRQRGAKQWFSAFGDLFENWCRTVTRHSVPPSATGYAVHMSDGIGDAQEIEDVVIHAPGKVILVSVKAWIVPENDVRQAQSRPKAVAWLRRQFFQNKSSDRRGGAVRLLDKKIRALRSGAYPQLDCDAQVFLLIVTYDDIGDNPFLYAWLERESGREGLLQDERVAPITVASSGDYETFMGLLHNQIDPFAVLEGKTSSDNARARFRDWLQTFADSSHHRPGWAQQQYRTVADRTKEMLFNHGQEASDG